MNKKITVLGLLLLFQSSLAITTNLYKKATRELFDKDSVGALVDFQNCLNFTYCNDSAYYYLAVLHKAITKSPENYFQNIDLFLEKGHKNNRLTWQLAQYTAEKNHRKAEIHLKKLLDDSDYRAMAADLLMKFFRRNVMVDSLLKYEELLSGDYSPNQTLLKRNLRMALKAGNLQQIKTLGNLALSQDGKDPLAHYALSIVHFENMNWPLAYAHALSAGEMQKNFQYYRARLHALYKYKKWDKIHREAKIYVEDMKNFPNELNMYTRALLEIKAEGEAAPLLKILQNEPNWKFMDPMKIAMVFYRQGMYADSRRILLKFNKKNRNDMDVIYGILGDIARAQDSLIEAGDYYQKSFTYKENRDYRKKYIDICFALGEITMARSSIELLEKDDPNNPVLLKYLHEIYRLRNDQNKLIDILERRRKIETNNNALKLELARLYVLKNKWQLAEPLLDDLYTTYEDYSSGDLYSTVLIRNGNFAASLKVLEKLFPASGEDMHILQKILSVPAPWLTLDKRIYYTKLKLDKEPHNLALRKSYVKMVEEWGEKGPEYAGALIGLYDKTPSNTGVLNTLVGELSKTSYNTININYLEKVIQQDDNYRHLKKLGDLYAEKGKDEQSLKYYTRAYGKYPEGKLHNKIYSGLKNQKGKKAALDFMIKHTSRFENDHESQLLVSRELEKDNRKLALKYSFKSYKAQETRGNAFQYSKLKLLLSSQDHSKVKPELPWKKYAFAGDTLNLLKGLSDYNSKKFERASQRLADISDLALGRAARPALLFSLQHVGGWTEINKMCESIVTQSLLLSEFYACGEGLWRTGQFAKLEKLSTTHQKHNDKGNINVTYQGLAQFAQGDYSSINDLFENMEYISKFKNESYWAHGYSLYKTEKYKEAEKVWANGEKFLSHWDSLYYYRSESQIALKEYASASLILNRGLEKHPRSLPLIKQKIRLAGHMQNREDIFAYSKKLARLSPQDMNNNVRLAQFYMEKNRPVKVLEVLNGRKVDKEPAALMLMAEAAYQLSDYEKAISASRKALELDKRNSRAYYIISQAHEKAGNFAESQEYFHKFSEFAGKD